MKSSIQKAAEFIKNADVILIGAGAGIGRDSGLPDFRGNEGFWNNYPPYRGKFDFYDCANPMFLEKQPNLFWGFYGSRLQMYRKAIPHKGFQIMLDFERKNGKKLFAVTSNVDGQFQKAGYGEDKVYEVHGSIHLLQCDKCIEIIDNHFQPKINYEKMSCENLPQCKKCKEIVRPNILMFNDYTWMSERSDTQNKNYKKFLKQASQKSVCLIEIGAGTAVPTIRNMLEWSYFNDKKSKYIRINPDKEDNSKTNPQRFVHLELGCLDALTKIMESFQKL